MVQNINYIWIPFLVVLWNSMSEKAMATHFSILAWKIPWTEEPGGLQSMGSQTVRHNWACMQKQCVFSCSLYVLIMSHGYTIFRSAILILRFSLLLLTKRAVLKTPIINLDLFTSSLQSVRFCCMHWRPSCFMHKHLRILVFLASWSFYHPTISFFIPGITSCSEVHIFCLLYSQSSFVLAFAWQNIFKLWNIMCLYI